MDINKAQTAIRRTRTSVTFYRHTKNIAKLRSLWQVDCEEEIARGRRTGPAAPSLRTITQEATGVLRFAAFLFPQWRLLESNCPGGGRCLDASSRTRTQSCCPAGVNCLAPVAGKFPAAVAFPVRGSNHQALTSAPENLVISTVMVRAEGIYAITVLPS